MKGRNYQQKRIDNGLPELPKDSVLICTLKGYEDCKGYAVDKNGDVWTCKEHNFKANLYKDYWRKFVLKNNKHGYPYIIMTNEERRLTMKVHKLMACAFIPNHENLPFINHKDAVKTNNCIENLEWCTPSQNTNHYMALGLRNTATGRRLPNAKLSDNDIPEIFKLKKQGKLNKEIAALYNIEVSIISRILNRKRWSHVPI